ncbi:MAG: redoxin family protein [Planctomycetes bacterium]|nr:redoxin family protein [Planctomycetota bacterium]
MFARLLDEFGPDAELRFVRAYSHLERTEFARLSTEFLQNRESALRRFLAQFDAAAEAHRARVLLAHTLGYREATAEAESLLKMVILTTPDAELGNEARFTLTQLYRKTDPIQARILLREIASSSRLDDASKARACLELAGLLDRKAAVPVLREGGALADNSFARRCRLQLARLTLREEGRLQPGQPARPFRVKAVDGRVLTELDFAGKVYLIYFWSRHMPTAEGVQTYLGALRQNFADEGFEILGVNLDGEPPPLAAAAAEGRLPWCEVGDPWGALTELVLRYAPDPPPFCILIDRAGLIRFEGDPEAPEAATRYAETPLWKRVLLSVRTLEGTA